MLHGFPNRIVTGKRKVKAEPMIHRLADVQSSHIGENTQIWQYCVVLPGARIGRNCNICAQCFIENDVVRGDDVTIKCGVQIWDGMRIGDGVFIGPNATFCNDRYPISRARTWAREPVHIAAGACIGANATILPGVTIGRGAIVGAGAVVTEDVAAGMLVIDDRHSLRTIRKYVQPCSTVLQTVKRIAAETEDMTSEEPRKDSGTHGAQG